MCYTSDSNFFVWLFFIFSSYVIVCTNLIFSFIYLFIRHHGKICFIVLQAEVNQLQSNLLKKITESVQDLATVKKASKTTSDLMFSLKANNPVETWAQDLVC